MFFESLESAFKQLFFVAILIISISSVSEAQQWTLRFDPLAPTKGTSVRYVATGSGTVSSDAVSNLPLQIEETQDHKYVLGIDMSTFQRDKFHRFGFDAYLRSSGGNQKELQKFKIIEQPVGAFLDGFVSAPFFVDGSSGTDSGTIRLPIHSDDGSDNISVDTPGSPMKVSFSGMSSLELGLSNKLDLPVTVLRIDLSSTQCPLCWSSDLSGKPNLTVLRPHSSTSLTLSVHPNTFKALGRSIISLNPNIAHDALLISVASVADDGGLVAPQEFKLPVRFAPPALYLFATVVVAGLCGALLHLWLAPPAEKKRRDFLIAFIVAICVWFMTLVLFTLETRVTVFGYTLDPTQIIPAGLIGLLAAGGPPLVAKLKDAFGR